MKRRKLLFLVTEDWFARSHFLPLLARARTEGHEVVVACRDSGADLGAVRRIAFPFARGSLRPLAFVREAKALRDLVRRERPALIHAIALRPIALVLVAGLRRCGSVFALTGRGFLALHTRIWSRIVAGLVRRWLRAVVTGRANHVLLVENPADADWVGAELPADQVVVMPGAGVDPEQFRAMPEPPGAIVVGLVSRLLYAKGVDLAVNAVQNLRSRGLDVCLQIAGEPDGDHPGPYSSELLERWRKLDGVCLLGRVTDVSAFWARAHIACLPSRGGEGLPRSLLEAAACGRPAVTTDVPGCRDFVIDGETGMVVAPEDVHALAAALATLTSDAALRRRLGDAARARVCAGYTEAHAASQAAIAWRRALGED